MKNASISELLIRRFIKTPDAAADPKTRRQYAVLSSGVGICCNVFLFLAKMFSAYITHSSAVIADAFNNLSDCGNCIVTILGCRIASKPADKDHPFGHGRIEYLTSLILSVLIIVMGLELLRDSVAATARGRAGIEELSLSVPTVSLLVLAICIKLWMFFFNSKIGKRINSVVFAATAKDSFNDSVATTLSLAALVLSKPLDLPLDGIGGIIVSLFILKSGYDIVHDTFEEIIGKPADPELIAKIREIVIGSERVIGVHDLILHSYGPTKAIGSCHAEFRSTESFIEIHEIVDGIEHEISEKLGISMTIHMDPVQVDDAFNESLKNEFKEVLGQIDSSLAFHDFHSAHDTKHMHVSADISAPFELKLSDDEIKHAVEERFASGHENCGVSLTIDRE